MKFEKRVTSNTFFRRWSVNRTNNYDLKHKLQRLVKWIEIVFLHYKPLFTPKGRNTKVFSPPFYCPGFLHQQLPFIGASGLHNSRL